MAEDILGISGQMDISDIQTSLDKLCNDLNRVGVDTDALSQKMTKALNDVAKSDDDLSTKTSRAMQVLKTAMDEATQSIQPVPLMIDTANKHVETIEGTIGRLNEQLSKTDKGSEAFNSITKQIDIQKQSLELAKGDVKDLVESYDNVRNSISQVNGAYQALGSFSVASSTANAVQSATNISVGATATTAATATAAEAAAHISNAQAATQNAEAETQNVEATRQLTDALQQYISVASGRAEIERMQSENTKELKADIKLYEQAINDIQQKLGSTDYAKNIEEATKKIEVQKEKIESYKEAISHLSSDDNQSGQGANYYNHLIQIAQENIDSLQSKINAMSDEQQRLNADLREYTTLLEAANQIQGGKTIVQPDSSSSTVSINVEDTSLSELNSKLEESKQRLQELEAEADKFSGKPLGDKQKADLENLQSEIEKTKNEISAIQEAIREKNEETFIGRLRNDISDIGQKLSDFGQSIKDKITQPIDELKSKIGNTSIGQRFSAEFEQAKNGLNDFKDGIVNVLTANGKLQGEVGKVGDAFKALGIPVTGSLTAIKSVTKALWGMCATPIGAVIAAVALSFKALHTWLTKSAEGQKVLTKLSAYFGSLMASITDIVVIFGKYLYHAFADNNAPMNSFAKSFIKTFKTAVNAAISLVSGLGTTLKGIFTLDWDTFTDGLSKTWDGLKKAGTAAIEAVGTSIKGTVGALKTAYNMFTDDKLGKELGSAFNGIFTKASSAAKLAEQEQNANIQLGKEKEKQAKLDIQIAANREKIYTLTGKAKDAMIEETKALMKQKYDGQIKAQQQLYEIQKKRNQMHTASLSDIKKERDLHIDILNTQAQQMASTRMLTRMQEANRRSMENAEKQKNKKTQTDAKKEQNQENAVSSAEGKLANVIYGNAYARVKAEKELEDAVTDAKIKAMEEGEEKVIAQRKRELEKEIEQIEEKKNALIKAERDRQKAEFDAQQAVIKAKGGKIEQWDDNKYLDNKPINNISQQYNLIQQKAIESYNRELNDSETQALNAYIKEYGTYQQKRLAIAKEYSEKIKKAQTQGDKDSLQAQLNKSLSDLDFNEFKNKMNWEDIFGNLGNLTIKQLKLIKEQLRSLLKEGNVDADKYKTTVEQINKVNEAIVTSQDKIKSAFGLLLPMAEQRKILETNVAEAQERQNEAIRQQVAAQSGLDNSKLKVQLALQKAKVYDVPDSMIRTDRSQVILSKVAEKNGVDSKEYKDVSDAMTEVAESENKVNDANEKVITSTNNLANAQSKLKIFSEDFANKLKGLSEVIGVVASNMQSLPDLFGQLGISSDSAFGKAASDFANAGSSAMSSLSALQSGNFVGALAGGIGTVKSTISGFTNLLGLGGNGKEVAKTTENLQKANERLTYSIDALKDSIDKQSGARAVSSYEKAYEAQKQANQNAMKILETQMGYHGSHHSNSYYWNLSDNDYAKINSVLKSQADVRGGYSEATINSVHSLEDIYKLTPEQMKDIRVYASDVWKTMTDQGKYDKSEFWENVTEQAEKLDELTQKINENLTQMSFDSMKSNFLNDLMDMSKDAKDVANDMSNNFAEALQKSMLNYSLSDTYDKTLKPLYEKWAAAMKNHTLSKTEIDAYKKEYDDAVQEGLRHREQIAQITGYTGSQSEQTATGKAIEATTADQASSLIGIGYAMQIALEQGNEVRKEISLDVSFLRSYSETIGNNISEMRDIQYQGLEQLQAINKNTAPIILIREDIASMYKLMKDRY